MAIDIPCGRISWPMVEQFRLKANRTVPPHRCHFVLMQSWGAWRITKGPYRIAERLRTFSCKCGKVHTTNEGTIIYPEM